MTRPTMVLLSLLCLLPSARASFAPRTDPADLGKELLAGKDEKLPEDLLQGYVARDQKEEFLVTERTEVMLNGCACKYQEVPANAAVVDLVVGADQKTVLKIHFRTKK